MKTRTLLLFVCPLVLVLPVAAADWPQWRGPNRDGLSKETGLLKTWPKEGPKLLWTNEEMGVGYSGPSIVGDRLYCLGAGDQEYVMALDVQTGKKVWSTDFSKEIVRNRGDGPRGSPTVDGEFLYAIGSQGELVCLETATGKLRWMKNLKKDLGGRMMSGWGYCESPLVDGDQLICSPGGSSGTLAALDKKSGEVLWRSKDVKDSAAYSSVIVAEVGGVRQYIQMTEKGAVGVSAKDGQVLWHYSQPAYRTAVVPTPVYHDGHVYVTSGYGAGCDLIKLKPDVGKFTAEKVYANKTMVNHHGGVILVGEHVYGYSDGKGWVCQELMIGDSAWESKKLGKGSVTFADGRLYCYAESDGTLALVEATPKGWNETGRFKLPRQTKLERNRGMIWTHPVVANGRVYLRDQDLLFCFDVNAQTTGAE